MTGLVDLRGRELVKSAPPAPITAALMSEGMNNTTNFGPGTPLQPASGYSIRPRSTDYPVGVNINLSPRTAWGRTSFETLKGIIDSYDVARMCCVPGTLVVTIDGLKPIENVQVGDRVLTHLGRWRVVTETITNAPGRPVYAIRANGFDSLHVTGNHPLYVGEYVNGPTHAGEFQGLAWKAAEDISARITQRTGVGFDAQVLPAIRFAKGVPTLDVAGLLGGIVRNGQIVGMKRASGTPIPAQVPLDAAFGRILGWYLAEGSISQKRTVFFSLGPDENHFAEQIAADLSNVFGLTAMIEPSPAGRGITVRVSSTSLARLLVCGIARTKSIPAWVWTAGREFMAASLASWADGDGCRSQRDGQSPRVRVVTSSQTLAWQMRLIAVSLGLEASVVTTHLKRNKDAVIRGVVVNTHPIAYRVEWRESPQRHGWSRFEDDGRYLATPIRAIERVEYDGLVYNLEVADDESYVTTGGTVHNCINHKIDEIRSMEPLFQPAVGVTGDVDVAIDAARAALAYPDRVNSYDSWISLLLEGALRYDATVLYRRRNRGGDVIALEVVDGTTVFPYIDEHGRRPQAPAPAYWQKIKGLSDVWFTTDDISYGRFRPQTDSPFGLAPIESILLTANTDLRFQWHFLQMFTDGTIPAGLMPLPEDVSSPDQVAEWQDYWDAFTTGDQSILHKLIAVPAGTSIIDTKPEQFDKAFPQYLMMRTAAAYGVVPQDLGLIDDVNRANGETQVDVQFRVNTLPWVRFVEGIVNRYLQRDLGLPVKVSLDTGRDKEDRLQDAQVWNLAVQSGAVSSDEWRSEMFGLPIDNERPVPRGIISSRLGFVPIVAMERVAGPVDPETISPVDDVPLDTTPFDGTDGIFPSKLPGGTEFKRTPTDPEEPEFPAQEQPVPGTDVVADQTAPVVAKADTAGVTSETGIDGVDMVDGDDEDAAELRKSELVAFRKFAAARRKSGKWRPFEFEHVDTVTAHRLNVGSYAAIRKDAGEVGVAGLAVVAEGTGRVLMLQRALDPEDPAAGTWEVAGGHLEQGETPLEGAMREWQEEIGQAVPDGETTGSWLSPDGHYQGFVWQIASESQVDLLTRDEFTNPDDPDGDIVEAIAWWDPAAISGAPVIRQELAVQADLVVPLLGGGVDPKVVALAKSWRDTPNLVPQHEYDLKITDYYQPLIQAALQEWVSRIPVSSLNSSLVKATTTDDAAGASAAAVIAEQVQARLAADPSLGDMADLERIIRQIIVDGYLTGGHGAIDQVGASAVVAPDATGKLIIDMDWSKWVPGNPEAAAKVADGGLRTLLDQAGVSIKSIADTSLDQAGNIIGDGLARGDSVDTIARALGDIVASPSRAEMIAHTETARAQTAASFDIYRASGIGEWDLLTVAGACPVCMAVAAANPHPVADSSDAPPVHPRCRCAASPHV